MSVRDKKDQHGRLKAKCEICGKYYHRVDIHVKKIHSMTADQYSQAHPNAPLFSEYGIERLTKKEKKSMDLEGEKGKGYSIGVAKLNMRNVDDLDEVDKAYVPSHDPNWVVDRKVMNLWEDISVGVEEKEPVYIGGPTGCGKTKAVMVLAAALKQPVCRVQLNRDFRVAEFVGQRTLEENKDGGVVTSYKYGVLPTAMKRGWWLLLDEMDRAHSDVLMKLQGVLEGAPLVLTENFGEVVYPHEFFRIIATANTFGRGDDSGLYASAKIQDAAMIDRFGIVVDCDYPEEKSEVEILVRASKIEASTASKMVECARKIREAAKKEECNCTFSTRVLLSWAKKAIKYKNVRRAARVTVLNKMGYDDKRYVESVIQRFFSAADVEIPF
jgi:cobaltochelatase CobS